MGFGSVRSSADLVGLEFRADSVVVRETLDRLDPVDDTDSLSKVSSLAVVEWRSLLFRGRGVSSSAKFASTGNALLATPLIEEQRAVKVRFRLRSVFGDG